MYDTINYLNNQCELLQNEKQILMKEIEDRAKEDKGSQEELLEYLHDIAEAIGCQNIQEVLQKCQDLRLENDKLREREEKAEEKYRSIIEKFDVTLKKIDEGLGYEIIEEKDEAVRQLTEEVETLSEQLGQVKQENKMLVEENQKIAEELQTIEQRVKNITLAKGAHSEQSKLGTHRTQDITQGSLRRNTENMSTEDLMAGVSSKE